MILTLPMTHSIRSRRPASPVPSPSPDWLAGWHILNADDDLVIGRSRRGLKQFPEALDQFPLISR
jgi:hypothetical protein